MENRTRLPETRRSITHKGAVASTEFYLTVGLYDDDTPGELFVTIAKEGSSMSGVFDAFATATSLLLQSGWTIDELATKFRNSRFEPQGHTKNRDIPKASSIVDYIFHWMEMRWGKQTS